MKDYLIRVSAQLGSPGDLNLPETNVDSVAGILNIAFFVIGAAAVIMLIVGALMLITSGGNPDRIKRAKAAILYAVIGLAVAISAALIVNLVVTLL